MNYQKIYDDICKRGQVRILPKEVYTEKHHIIPKCLGGGNEKSNLTILTAKEHFLVHYILCSKLYPSHRGLWYALMRMCNSNNKFQNRHRVSSKLYEYVRVQYSMNSKGKNSPNFGRRLSEKQKEIIRTTHIGKTMSLTHKNILKELYTNKSYEERFGAERAKEIKEKQSESTNHHGERNPNFGKQTPQHVREKISNSLKGQILSAESIEKIRIKAIGRLHSEQTKQKCKEIALNQSDRTKQKKSENCSKNKLCRINNVEYRSAAFAGKQLGINDVIVRYRINSNADKWKEWIFLQ